MARRAIICGGSLGGLFAAAALQQRGWQITVLERTPVPLAGRGAGIVTHPELVAALASIGASAEGLGIDVYERVAYDIDGARVRTVDFHQVVTSWDRMFQSLRATIADAAYRMGQDVQGYEEEPGHVAAILADGQRIEADLLVGADGFRSAIRAQWQPEVRSAYSGYVVWRTVAPEAALPKAIRADIFGTFGFFLPNGSQIIGYPIAGPDNDLRPGHRRYNFVWYDAVSRGRLVDMLTDADGTRHDMSIPPPRVRDDVIARVIAEAKARLPKPFVEILELGERPFFTPIYDHLSPVMGAGRIALAGDAACGVRPHLGMGVTKAAEDALALARHLDAAPVPEALSAYSAQRVAASRLAFETSRRLGGYIFDCDHTRNRQGRAHPQMARIMRETAAIPDAASETP